MALKASVRMDMKRRLKQLTSDEMAEQSRAVLARLSEMPAYQSSNGACLYLSMGGEINTDAILTDSFQRRKKVFIPKIMGKKSADMFMLEVPSMDTIHAFAKNNWGIPEPPTELIMASTDGTYSGLIDMVLLPGVAFDKYCNRLGHGKGYYDSFVDRLTESNMAMGKPAPYLVGLALNEQIIEDVPVETHDRVLDAVVTPSAVYYKDQP